MAEIAAVNVTQTAFGGALKGRAYRAIALGDTTEALAMANLADKSVQVVGNFDGGSFSVQGSLDSNIATAIFTELTNPQGDALVFTAAGLETILQNVYWIKVVLTGGGASTDVDVLILAKGTH